MGGAGYRVALLSRSESELDAVAGELSGESLVVPCDVTDPAAVEAAFATVEATWGPVEVLVVSAGAGASAPLAETSDEDWQGHARPQPDRAVPLHPPRPAIDDGRRVRPDRRRGIGGRQAWGGADRGVLPSKHGVLGLVRSGAAEVAGRGVTLNAVCPGYVDTPMTDDSVSQIASRTGKSAAEAREILARRQPIGRLVTVEEVASAVLLCVENGAINGQGDQRRRWGGAVVKVQS